MLTRRAGSAIHIGEDITVVIAEIHPGQVRIGIEAPRDIPIRRAEKTDRPRGGGEAAGPDFRGGALRARAPGSRGPGGLLALALGLALAAAFLLAPRTGIAQVEQTPVGESVSCPDASVFGGSILTHVCMSCFFPIRFGAAPPGTPLGAAGPVCTCPGRIFGYPTTGPTLGMWMPGHLLEVVRSPFCSPALGGELPLAGGGAQALAALRMQGGPEVNRHRSTKTDVYYNMHYYSFPVAQLLSSITDAVCVANTGADMAVLYMSEIDPTWDNEPLALSLNPEAALYASPPALAACLADATAASVAQPIPALLWCAGSWGSIYPPSGRAPSAGSVQQSASLVATKGLALAHQRGLGLLTYTDLAVCRDIPFPILPKNQYKLQTMHPIPELATNHWIGASTFRWGEWRHISAVGEDFVYLVWNWQECCGNP